MMSSPTQQPFPRRRTLEQSRFKTRKYVVLPMFVSIIPVILSSGNMISGTPSSQIKQPPSRRQEVSSDLGEDDQQLERTSKKKRGARALTSLFELNIDAMAEASEVNEDEILELPVPSPSDSSSDSTSSDNNGQGGALVKTTKPDRRFQSLAPLDTSRVAPLSSRLLEDSDEKETESETDEDRFEQNALDASVDKMRWFSLPPERLQEEEKVEPDEGEGKIEAENLANVNDQRHSTNSEKLPREESINDNRIISSDEAQTVEKEESDSPFNRENNVTKSSLDNYEVEDDYGDALRNSKETIELVQKGETLVMIPPYVPPEEKAQASRDSENPFASLVMLPPYVPPEEMAQASGDTENPFLSSGYWGLIDAMFTLGLSNSLPALRISTRLRTVRKITARLTGLHGWLSGKGRVVYVDVEDEELGIVRRRIAAIDRARENIDRARTSKTRRRGLFGQGGLFGHRKPPLDDDYSFILKRDEEAEKEELRRKERVKEIDKLIKEGQSRLLELVVEKDYLQQRPNPLFQYSTETEPLPQNLTESSANSSVTTFSRKLSFPPDDLVDEYLDVLFSSNRLVKMNHTHLWKNGGMDEDDDEDELSSSQSAKSRDLHRKRRNDGILGNWVLRQQGLGEKIGEATETAAYKSICKAVMSVLARSISSIHGMNIMSHSDIRLSMEQVPDLPPLAEGIIPGSGKNTNYAQGAIQDVIRRGARKSRKRRRRSQDDAFIQRDAVVETLLSQSQIAAPLLKLFPLEWQRSLLGNIITLVCAVVTDFCEGLEFQILGHLLSFSFVPITEEDMIRRIGMGGDGFNRNRAKQEEFEAAVRATANDVGETLKFLDRWHERALGSGMLREQIAQLIARLVISLVDDVLSGARMDLWAAHAGGPRMVAGLEYRTTPTYMEGTGKEKLP